MSFKVHQQQVHVLCTHESKKCTSKFVSRTIKLCKRSMTKGRVMTSVKKIRKKKSSLSRKPENPKGRLKPKMSVPVDWKSERAVQEKLGAYKKTNIFLVDWKPERAVLEKV